MAKIRSLRFGAILLLLTLTVGVSTWAADLAFPITGMTSPHRLAWTAEPWATFFIVEASPLFGPQSWTIYEYFLSRDVCRLSTRDAQQVCVTSNNVSRTHTFRRKSCTSPTTCSTLWSYEQNVIRCCRSGLDVLCHAGFATPPADCS